MCGDTINFTSVLVAITRPYAGSNAPTSLAYSQASWFQFPYHLDWQGVILDIPPSIGAGEYPLTFSGSVAPSPITYRWKLTGGGCFEPNCEDTVEQPDAPTHRPPTTPQGGTLKLSAILEEQELFFRERSIQIYADHLKRDADVNFFDDRWSTKWEGGQGPFMELPNFANVSGSMMCSSAASHCYDGVTRSGAGLWQMLGLAGWTATSYSIPGGFQSHSYPRGTKFKLKYDSTGAGGTGAGGWQGTHHQTVKAASNGLGVQTYAADSTTMKFRHEHPKDYFYKVFYGGGPMTFQEWETEQWNDNHCEITVLTPP